MTSRNGVGCGGFGRGQESRDDEVRAKRRNGNTSS